MRQVSVFLATTEQVQRFVKTLTALSGEFEVISGAHILDARSLMGFFSMDLSNPITLKVYNDSAENMGAIAPFLVTTEGNQHE